VYRHVTHKPIPGAGPVTHCLQHSAEAGEELKWEKLQAGVEYEFQLKSKSLPVGDAIVFQATIAPEG
jgi:hypothetical protein